MPGVRRKYCKRLQRKYQTPSKLTPFNQESLKSTAMLSLPSMVRRRRAERSLKTVGSSVVATNINGGSAKIWHHTATRSSQFARNITQKGAKHHPVSIDLASRERRLGSRVSKQNVNCNSSKRRIRSSTASYQPSKPQPGRRLHRQCHPL